MGSCRSSCFRTLLIGLMGLFAPLIESSVVSANLLDSPNLRLERCPRLAARILALPFSAKRRLDVPSTDALLDPSIWLQREVIDLAGHSPVTFILSLDFAQTLRMMRFDTADARIGFSPAHENLISDSCVQFPLLNAKGEIIRSNFSLLNPVDQKLALWWVFGQEWNRGHNGRFSDATLSAFLGTALDRKGNARLDIFLVFFGFASVAEESVSDSALYVSRLDESVNLLPHATLPLPWFGMCGVQFRKFTGGIVQARIVSLRGVPEPCLYAGAPFRTISCDGLFCRILRYEDRAEHDLTSGEVARGMGTVQKDWVQYWLLPYSLRALDRNGPIIKQRINQSRMEEWLISSEEGLRPRPGYESARYRKAALSTYDSAPAKLELLEFKFLGDDEVLIRFNQKTGVRQKDGTTRWTDEWEKSAAQRFRI